MRHFSIPMLIVCFFGIKFSDKRVLLSSWRKLKSASLERANGQYFDAQATRLPHKKNYSWRVYTGWSLLHLVAFEPITILLGGILFFPACLISLWKLGQWFFRLIPTGNGLF
jgi:hypothetical protein